MVLGRHLGPGIDMSPVMMKHVMKANDKVEDRSIIKLLALRECVKVIMHKEKANVLLFVNGQAPWVWDLMSSISIT